MSLSNGFLQVSPAVKRPIGAIKANEQSMSQYGFLDNSQTRRIPSSFDTYSAESKDFSIKEIINEKYLKQQKRKQKSLPHTLPFNKNNFLVQNTNNERVTKTIDSVNEYAEQLRLTLIKQYKAQKMKSIRAKKAKGSDEPLTSATQFQTLDEISDYKLAKIKDDSSKNPAYKTLNLLYQAIIDNSFKNRKKDEFQLQAVRLPIVDRFNNRTETLRLQRELNSKCQYSHNHRAEFSLPEPITYSSPYQKTKTTFNTHKIQWKKQKSKTHRLANDDSQIIPWVVAEQSVFE